MSRACLMHLHALSPVHMGSGLSEGALDLRHAREAQTGLPVLPGSGLKGVLRDEFASHPDLMEDLFGTDFKQATAAGGSQGKLMFGDGALLALPVRSLHGTFVWATSPYLLMRWTRDREAVRLGAFPHALPTSIADGEVWTGAQGISGTAYIHDLCLTAAQKPLVDELVKAWAAVWTPTATSADNWAEQLGQRLVIVSDAVMLYLCDMAMEVRARVRLEDEVKLVQKGALWYEESLPAETLAYAVVAADDQNAMTDFAGVHVESFGQLQIGGKATVGRGWVRTALEPTASGGTHG